jgi:hypothetical protein
MMTEHTGRKITEHAGREIAEHEHPHMIVVEEARSTFAPTADARKILELIVAEGRGVGGLEQLKEILDTEMRQRKAFLDETEQEQGPR